MSSPDTGNAGQDGEGIRDAFAKSTGYQVRLTLWGGIELRERWVVWMGSREGALIRHGLGTTGKDVDRSGSAMSGPVVRPSCDEG